MSIKKIDFLAWKNDLITKEVFKVLEEAKENYLLLMTGGELLSNPNGLLQLNRYKGYIEAIDDVVNITIEEDEEDEKSDSSGI